METAIVLCRNIAFILRKTAMEVKLQSGLKMLSNVKAKGTLAAVAEETVMHTCRYAVLGRSRAKAAQSHRQRRQSSRLQTETAARENEQIAATTVPSGGRALAQTLHTVHTQSWQSGLNIGDSSTERFNDRDFL